MDKITFTRRQYLNGKCTHRQYYAQYVTPEVTGEVLNRWSRETLLASFQEDNFFNSLITPLRLWGEIPLPKDTDSKMRRRGDYLTLAGRVCICKEAAQQIVGEENERE